MIVSTPGLVLHTTPYGDTSVVAKVFTRQLGVRSYIIKGVRGPRGRVKQNLLQPLSSIDMVVYDNPKSDLNYIKELSPRNPLPTTHYPLPTQNALRFFMTEVLYRTLREEEPMPELFDYVESSELGVRSSELSNTASCDEPRMPNPNVTLPIRFLLTVAHHLGIGPLDNYSRREPFFDLQEGRYMGAPSETTLSPSLSLMLHEYLSNPRFAISMLNDRRAMLDALIAYYQLHLSGFRHFHSHEILHTILKQQ